MESGFLSIIIPAYNSSKTIAKCIESIEENQEKCFEIVVVDDGSTDDQNKIISHYIDLYGNIRLIKQKNTGCVGARLRGFLCAKGNYCTTVDSDDVVSGEYVATICELIDSNPDVDMFFLNNFRNDNGPEDFIRERQLKDELTDDKTCCLDRIWFGQEGAIWNKIFRRQLFEYCHENLKSYLKVTFAEDLLINTVYLSNPEVKKVLFSDSAVYYHYQQFGITSGSKFNENKLQDAYRRSLCLGRNIFGKGAFEGKTESEVYYWNIRYLVYQRLGGKHFVNKGSEKRVMGELWQLNRKYKCFTLKQWVSRISFEIFRK